MLNDVSHAFSAEHLVPEVFCFVPKGVRRVSFSVVVALVEGQEKGVFTCQLGGHVYFVGVYGKVHNATPKMQEGLPWVSVVFVLSDALYFGGLSGPGIF